jgi:hypothetical protein
LKMSPFEALYGRKCRTPLMWTEVGDRIVEKPDFIAAAEEKVAEIRENLKAAQARQKSYADTRRRELSFEVGDYVYLKVSPIRGTRRFQVRGKLAPRYIGPFKILKRVGAVAYKLQLPEEMSGVHDVFHVSQLRKCLQVPEQRIDQDTIDLQDDLRYQEVPVKILDTVTRKTRRTAARFCRVQWSRHSEAEATWEREDALRKEFPHLFDQQPNLEDEIPSKWGRFVTSRFSRTVKSEVNLSKSLIKIRVTKNTRTRKGKCPAHNTLSSSSLVLCFRHQPRLARHASPLSPCSPDQPPFRSVPQPCRPVFLYSGCCCEALHSLPVAKH